MKWEVIGADRKSGKDIKRNYEAGSEEAVALLAKEDGILVSSIDLLVDMDAPAVAATRSTSPMQYANPRTPRAVPGYTALSVLGVVLTIYAVCATSLLSARC
jgi:hypothetical protein